MGVLKITKGENACTEEAQMFVTVCLFLVTLHFMSWMHYMKTTEMQYRLQTYQQTLLYANLKNLSDMSKGSY